MRLAESEQTPVAPLCDLLGYTRQAYYKRTKETQKRQERAVLDTSVVLFCKHLRKPDNLPRAGCRQLYQLCQDKFKDKFTMGRDAFYDLLRANNLMLRKRRTRPRTTNSHHNLYKYQDLLNTDPKYIPPRPGALVVADITYIEYNKGFAYLSLLTDAYSRCIVGYKLHPTLQTEGPLQALKQALTFYNQHNIDTTNMIHHSDRGIQYASAQYTDLLKRSGTRISMTQTGDPLHNALAERINNTIKNSWLTSSPDQTLQQAQTAIDQAIRMYNEARPHQALNGKPPMYVIDHQHQNPLLTQPYQDLPPLPKPAPAMLRRKYQNKKITLPHDTRFRTNK